MVLYGLDRALAHYLRAGQLTRRNDNLKAKAHMDRAIHYTGFGNDPVFYRVTAIKAHGRRFAPLENEPLVNAWYEQGKYLVNVYHEGGDRPMMVESKNAHKEVIDLQHGNIDINGKFQPCLVFDREFMHGYFYVLIKGDLGYASATYNSNVLSIDHLVLLNDIETNSILQNENARREKWNMNPLYKLNLGDSIAADLSPLVNVWRLDRGNMTLHNYYGANDKKTKDAIPFGPMFTKINTKQAPVEILTENYKDTPFYELYEHELYDKKNSAQLVSVHSILDVRFHNENLLFYGWRIENPDLSSLIRSVVEIIDSSQIESIVAMENEYRDRDDNPESDPYEVLEEYSDSVAMTRDQKHIAKEEEKKRKGDKLEKAAKDEANRQAVYKKHRRNQERDRLERKRLAIQRQSQQK